MAKYTLTITADNLIELANMLNSLNGENVFDTSLKAEAPKATGVGSRKARKAAEAAAPTGPTAEQLAEEAAAQALLNDEAPVVNIFDPQTPAAVIAPAVVAAPVAVAPVAEVIAPVGPELTPGFVAPVPAGNGAHPAAGGVTIEQLKQATTDLLARKSATQVTSLLKEKTGHPTAGVLYREAPQLAPLALQVLQNAV